MTKTLIWSGLPYGYQIHLKYLTIKHTHVASSVNRFVFVNYNVYVKMGNQILSYQLDYTP